MWHASWVYVAHVMGGAKMRMSYGQSDNDDGDDVIWGSDNGS